MSNIKICQEWKDFVDSIEIINKLNREKRRKIATQLGIKPKEYQEFFIRTNKAILLYNNIISKIETITDEQSTNFVWFYSTLNDINNFVYFLRTIGKFIEQKNIKIPDRYFYTFEAKGRKFQFEVPLTTERAENYAIEQSQKFDQLNLVEISRESGIALEKFQSFIEDWKTLLLDNMCPGAVLLMREQRKKLSDNHQSYNYQTRMMINKTVKIYQDVIEACIIYGDIEEFSI